MAFGRNGDTSFIEKSMDGAGGWNLDTTVYGADIIGIPLDGPDKGKHKLFDGIHTFAQLSYVEDMGGGGGGAVGSDDVTNESTVPGSTVTAALNNVRVSAVTWSDANNPGGSGAFVPAVNQLVYITDGEGAGRIYRGNGSEDLIALIALGVYSEGSGTKVYRAYLTQTGTDAPVVAEAGKNTIGAIVWTRGASKEAIGTLTGAFPAGTNIQVTAGLAVAELVFPLGAVRNDNNTIVFSMATGDGTAQDEWQANITITVDA